VRDKACRRCAALVVGGEVYCEQNAVYTLLIVADAQIRDIT